MGSDDSSETGQQGGKEEDDGRKRKETKRVNNRGFDIEREKDKMVNEGDSKEGKDQNVGGE